MLTVYGFYPSSTLEAQTYRVITVEEQDGINYAITALTYVAGKYANIESGISLPTRTISLLNQPRNPPGNLQAQEFSCCNKRSCRF